MSVTLYVSVRFKCQQHRRAQRMEERERESRRKRESARPCAHRIPLACQGAEKIFTLTLSPGPRASFARTLLPRGIGYIRGSSSSRELPNYSNQERRIGVSFTRTVYEAFVSFLKSFSCRHSCIKVYTSFSLFLSSLTLNLYFLIFPLYQSPLSHLP